MEKTLTGARECARKCVAAVPRHHGEQMQTQLHSSSTAPMLLLGNYVVEGGWRWIFVADASFSFSTTRAPPPLAAPPPPPSSPRFPSQLTLLAALLSRAVSCNHPDSVACSIYPSIQDYCDTISAAFFWKLSNLSNTDTISGGSVTGRI